MTVNIKDSKFIEKFRKNILDWYKIAGRKNLPWQKNRDPYRVWVSEIMLQQTQVTTVIPYFEKFMHAFSDVHALANATEDDVLHHWTGLGYYRRAHHLHQTAKIIAARYNGQFPACVEALSMLPGIGRSTAGAIVAMGFNRKAPIMDGNVRRVLSRFHAIEGLKQEKTLWALADAYTPENHVQFYTQAMMDLGAMVCTKHRPDCLLCPLSKDCQAFLLKRQADFPAKKPSKKLPVKKAILLLLLNKKGEVLLEKRPSRGIWSGLWSFPEAANRADIKKKYGTHIKTWLALTPFRHTFTHFHLDIFPLKGLVKKNKKFSDLLEAGMAEKKWYNPLAPQRLGLCAPVKKIIEKYLTPLA